MTKDEALKLALEALKKSTSYFNIVRLGESRLKDTEIRGASHAAITAIKEALAQPEQKRPQNCGTGYCSCIECVMEPEQEPVAWGFRHHDGAIYDCISPEAHADAEGDYTVPLYTTPPKRPWVGLTDEEIDSLQRLAIDPVDASGWGFLNRERYARLIEAKLKEKNT